MPAIQTAYNDRMRIGRAGHVSHMGTQDSITVQCEEADGIGFGLPVIQGVGDHGGLLPGGVALSSASSAKAGNTGNGTVTATPAVGAGAVEGRYTLVAIEPGANGGVFEFSNPEGQFIGTVNVGVAATIGGLGPFTIADGATDFVAGDAFYIDVTSAEGGTLFLGITIEDKTLQRAEGQPVDQFKMGDSMGLLTQGTIDVIAGGVVKAGEPAYYNPATKRYVAAGAFFQLPNCVYGTSSTANGDVVRLRVSAL